MRKFLIFFWLLIPLGVAAFHYGPGQQRLQADVASGHLASARAHLEAEDYKAAVAKFESAIKEIPENEADKITRLRLEKAKAQMLCGGLPDAHGDLLSLLDELGKADDTDPALVAETQSALAGAQYYMTWLMRLEGHPREVWEPEIESARQNYRGAAEFAVASGDAKVATSARENLEAAIKLARLDLTELQGLPLPSQ